MIREVIRYIWVDGSLAKITNYEDVKTNIPGLPHYDSQHKVHNLKRLAQLAVRAKEKLKTIYRGFRDN
jgi:hypothetical protein